MLSSRASLSFVTLRGSYFVLLMCTSTSLYLNLGTKHNVTFAQVVPGLFYDYVFKELHVGNETFTNPSYQLTILEPSSITAVYESRLSMLSIALASVAVSALVAVAYLIKRKHSSKVR